VIPRVIMKTIKEYLEHAEECEELARRARSPEDRKLIQGMAETWRMLAKSREKTIKPPDKKVRPK
jgi:hypothetical protein